MTFVASRRHIDAVTHRLFEPLALALRDHPHCHLVSWDGEQGLCATLPRGVTVDERDDLSWVVSD